MNGFEVTGNKLTITFENKINTVSFNKEAIDKFHMFLDDYEIDIKKFIDCKSCTDNIPCNTLPSCEIKSEVVADSLEDEEISKIKTMLNNLISE